MIHILVMVFGLLAVVAMVYLLIRCLSETTAVLAALFCGGLIVFVAVVVYMGFPPVYAVIVYTVLWIMGLGGRSLV